jgi:hypothetical protein
LKKRCEENNRMLNICQAHKFRKAKIQKAGDPARHYEEDIRD